KGDAGFLTRAAQLCTSIQATPIVLTVARSDREAQAMQDRAHKIRSYQGSMPDFDCLIGSEVRLAVANVTRWRRCQLLVMGRSVSKPWWRWLRDRRQEWFMEMNPSSGLLTLLGTGPLEQRFDESAKSRVGEQSSLSSQLIQKDTSFVN